MKHVSLVVEIEYADLVPTGSEIRKFEFSLTDDHVWANVVALIWSRLEYANIRPTFTIDSVPIPSQKRIEDFNGHLNVVARTDLEFQDRTEALLSSYTPITFHVQYGQEIKLIKMALHDNMNRFIEQIDLENAASLVLFIKSFDYIKIENTNGDISNAIDLDFPVNTIEILACLPTPKEYTIDIDFDDGIHLDLDRFVTEEEFSGLLLATGRGDFYYKGKKVGNSLCPLYDAMGITGDRIEFIWEKTGERFFENKPVPLKSEPMRIALSNGLEWGLTGDTYHKIKANRENAHGEYLLVGEEGLTSCVYQFVADSGKICELNTSQCIVVDNGFHEPYILVNPSGKAKLCGVIGNLEEVVIRRKLNGPTPTPTSRESIARADVEPNHFERLHLRAEPRVEEIQPMAPIAPIVNRIERNQGEAAFVAVPDAIQANQGAIRVAFNNDNVVGDNANQANPNVAPARNRSVLSTLLNLIQNNLNQIGSHIIRYGFVIYMLNLHLLIMEFFEATFILVTLASSFYIFFLSGTRLTDWLERIFLNGGQGIDTRLLRKFVSVLKFTNSFGRIYSSISSTIREVLFSACIQRTYDFEYVILKDEGHDNFFFWVTESFNNLWKDIILFVLSFMDVEIQRLVVDQMENWRQAENILLELRVSTFYQKLILTIELYQAMVEDPHLANTAATIILQSLVTQEENTENDPQSQDYSAEELREIKYQKLLAKYKELAVIYGIFMKAIATRTPLPHN